MLLYFNRYGPNRSLYNKGPIHKQCLQVDLAQWELCPNVLNEPLFDSLIVDKTLVPMGTNKDLNIENLPSGFVLSIAKNRKTVDLQTYFNTKILPPHTGI